MFLKINDYDVPFNVDSQYLCPIDLHNYKLEKPIPLIRFHKLLVRNGYVKISLALRILNAVYHGSLAFRVFMHTPAPAPHPTTHTHTQAQYIILTPTGQLDLYLVVKFNFGHEKQILAVLIHINCPTKLSFIYNSTRW